jgi:hypothetical protein
MRGARGLRRAGWNARGRLTHGRWLLGQVARGRLPLVGAWRQWRNNPNQNRYLAKRQGFPWWHWRRIFGVPLRGRRSIRRVHPQTDPAPPGAGGTTPQPLVGAGSTTSTPLVATPAAGTTVNGDPDMPARQRSTSASSGAAGQTTASSSAAASSSEAVPAWVKMIVDAVAAAEKDFTPDRARAVVAVMDHYPTVLEAMAKFAQTLGKKSIDSVDLPPSAQEMFAALGSIQMKSVGPARDGLAAAKKTVADRIARYQAQRSQDAAWDVRANRE